MKSMIYLNNLLEEGSTHQHRDPDWFAKELSAWKPPEKLKVSEWADKHRILESKTSAFPGKWKTSRTPYLEEVMNQYNVKEIEEIVFCCASQVGKTETLLNIQGYIVDQDPNPALIVYPTGTLAEFQSENRIKPMMQISPTLNEKFKAKRSKKLELQFDGMYIALSGANSPSSLSSRPVRYVLLDEVDKFPKWTGDEADPISLAKERTKTFYNKKIFMCSTPTIESGHIWKHLMSSDVIKQYYIPCPHCGSLQTLKMKQIKWPESLNDLEDVEEKARRVRRLAWYECEHCEDKIKDRHKLDMLRKGEWQPVRWTEEGNWEPIEATEDNIRKIGFHLNSIYSPWTSFGEVAAEFLESKDFPEKLQNFVNSWLGEPWRDESNYTKSDMVLEKEWTHERGRVPEDAVMLTAGVDVQEGHFWYVVRAWGERITSWLVDYGRAETWDEIEDIVVNRQYVKETGEPMLIKLAIIDSGYRPDDVYAFCSYFPEVCKPGKGSSRRLTAPYTVSKIDRQGFGNLALWKVDTHYFKDFIFGRLKKDPGSLGSFMVFKDCPRQYADQLTAEQKVMVQKKNGQVKEEYQLISSHAQNHLLDCEVYAACAAEVAGVRYLRRQKSNKKKQSNKSNKRNKKNDKSWIPQKKNWL